MIKCKEINGNLTVLAMDATGLYNEETSQLTSDIPNSDIRDEIILDCIVSLSLCNLCYNPVFLCSCYSVLPATTQRNKRIKLVVLLCPSQ